MALQYLDKNVLGQHLSNAWKSALNTGEDPANGQWYENGANNDNIGLYGGLTDTLADHLIFDENQKVYQPQEIIADTAIIDNRNGLAPQSTVQLSYAYAYSQSSSHSTTATLKLSTEHDIQASASIEVVSIQTTAKFTIEFDYSWTDANTETTGETQTFSQSVPVNVPNGMVYQVLLSATTQKLTVPYRSIIYVSGTTETWFPDRINGHYNWFVDAGTMFVWINQYGSAGGESYMYGSDPNNPSQGIVTLHGTVTAQQVANFKARVYDVTNSFIENNVLSIARAFPIGNMAIQGGILVHEISF